MKRDLLKTIVLMVSIVVVTVASSLLLNLVTGPKIEADRIAREEAAAQQAAGVLLKVFPGAAGFEDITATLTIDPASGVSAVHKETSDKGFVFISSSTFGNMKDDVVVTVGVNMDGQITGIDISLVNPNDYPVSDKTLTSFVGQDSTLGGVEFTTNATHSSTAIKTAVAAGFGVLAANDLMKAAVKTTEQVFEELLPTVFKGAVKGEDLAASGNITTAYKTSTGTGVICYVTKGESLLLAISNVNGVVTVYQSKLLDEATQTYELENVTEANVDVVTEVNAFATSSLVSSAATLADKIGRMYEGATDITEITINTYGTIAAAASFTYEGATYYAYLAKSINEYNKSVVTNYIVLDSEGKVAKFDLINFFGNEEYFGIADGFDVDGYENKFVGINDSTIDTNNELMISGATMTSNAVKQAMKDAFDAYASKGGNN